MANSREPQDAEEPTASPPEDQVCSEPSTPEDHVSPEPTTKQSDDTQKSQNKGAAVKTAEAAAPSAAASPSSTSSAAVIKDQPRPETQQHRCVENDVVRILVF